MTDLQQQLPLEMSLILNFSSEGEHPQKPTLIQTANVLQAETTCITLVMQITCYRIKNAAINNKLQVVNIR